MSKKLESENRFMLEDDLQQEIENQFEQEKTEIIKHSLGEREMLRNKVAYMITLGVWKKLLRNFKVRIIVTYKEIEIINYEFPKNN